MIQESQIPDLGGKSIEELNVEYYLQWNRFLHSCQRVQIVE